MNIYLTKTNEDNLRKLQDWSMSGLINMLLNDYWEKNTPVDVHNKIEKPLHKKWKKIHKEVIGEDITDKEIDDTLNTVMREDQPIHYCKHNADPRFCKHAKPGKPCKA